MQLKKIIMWSKLLAGIFIFKPIFAPCTMKWKNFFAFLDELDYFKPKIKKFKNDSPHFLSLELIMWKLEM